MGRVKFRYWDGFNAVMKYSEPDRWADYLSKFFIEHDNALDGGNDPALMQFTGLLDKNGKEIYEGDIVKVHEDDEWDDESAIKDFVVEWGGDYPAFTLKNYPDLEYNSLQHAANVVSCEVIGNIYEHGHLLNSDLLTTPSGG